MQNVLTCSKLIHRISVPNRKFLSRVVQSFLSIMDNHGGNFHTDSSHNAKNKQPNRAQKFVSKLPTLDPSSTANFKSVVDFPFNDRRVRLVSEQRTIHVGSNGVVYWMSRDQRVQGKKSFDSRDTRSNKILNSRSWMENHVVCHTIIFLSYEVGWSWIERVQIHMM